MIDVSGIAVSPDRLRKLRPETVDELVESMKERGLLQPIVIRPYTGSFMLVAGWHRLAAAKQLKWDAIRAEVREGLEADAAELAEIDENLVRAELSPAERAMHVGRRKELYEKQHPETKHGGAPAAGKGKGKRSRKEAKFASFQESTAKATGQSKRKIRLDATRAKNVNVLAEVAGTSLDKGDELDALAKLPADEQRRLADEAKAGQKVSAKTRVKQVKRAKRERDLADKQLSLPLKMYGVVVEDFEWDQKVWSRETGMDRHAANHYPVSESAHTPEEIVEHTKERAACAADDCAWFAWTTVPHLAIAIDVMRLRGLRYVTNWAWDKQKAGTGYWNRNRHEILLLGVRGKVPCPAPGEQWESLLSIAATEHSAKPEQFLEMIEAYFPNLPKIELNRRGPPRPGWEAWGYEAEPPANEDTDDIQESDDASQESAQYDQERQGVGSKGATQGEARSA
jgi:N6-adenosine-specific RNA methylase IME4